MNLPKELHRDYKSLKRKKRVYSWWEKPFIDKELEELKEQHHFNIFALGWLKGYAEARIKHLEFLKEQNKELIK